MELNIGGYTKSVMNYMLFDAIKKLKRVKSDAYDDGYVYKYPARGITVDVRIQDVKELLEFGHWDVLAFPNLANEDFE